MSVDGSYNPQTNDVLLRHLIMQYYTDTVEHGSNLKMWMNSPKTTRHGIIDRKGIPFRISFMRLYSMTKYIRGVNDTELVNRINTWMEKEFNEQMTQKQKEEYFKEGLKVSDEWSKVLFEQSIINFS